MKFTPGVIGLAVLVLRAVCHRRRHWRSVPRTASGRSPRVQDLQVDVREARPDVQARVQGSEKDSPDNVQDGDEPDAAELLAVGRVPLLISPPEYPV
jgi:hypothetical protein